MGNLKKVSGSIVQKGKNSQHDTAVLILLSGPAEL